MRFSSLLGLIADLLENLSDPLIDQLPRVDPRILLNVIRELLIADYCAVWDTLVTDLPTIAANLRPLDGD